MQKEYSSNYLNIYIWKGLSFVLNILSMLIVVPYLTKEPSIYGIYSICISVSIFLAYADLGFISSGIKYAAEYFSNNDRNNEIKVIGFTTFVLLLFLIGFSIIFFVFSLYPDLLIKNILDERELTIASSLLLIVSVFTPVTLLNRMLQMIFVIRLEDFVMQRINIIANIIKILSIFYFFGADKYNIVGYFLFCQIANLFAAIFTFYIVRMRYNYNIILLVKSLRFSSQLFRKTKSLAFSSLFIAITWISYYELDNLVIGRSFGASSVAIYAIGLTILSVFRSVFGIIFSPFGARFNHFVGLKNIDRLNEYYLQVMSLLAPMVILPVIAVSILSRPLILSWVGPFYSDSILITEIIVMANLFAFITYPTGLLLMARERIREMYIINSIIPIVYWLGIILTYKYWELNAFAIFKVLAFCIAAVYYFYLSGKYLKLSYFKLTGRLFSPLILPIIFVVLSAVILKQFLPIEKATTNIILVILSISMIIISGLLVQLLTSTIWRQKAFSILKALRIQ